MKYKNISKQRNLEQFNTYSWKINKTNKEKNYKQKVNIKIKSAHC